MRGLTPIKLLFLSFVIWLVFYIQMPVEYLYSGSILFPLITITAFILSFVFGMISLKERNIRILKPTTDSQLKQIIFVLYFIGLFGVILKMYVGFFKTGIFTAEDIFEERLSNMGKELSGGGIGVLASLLFPFSFLSFLIAIYNYKIFNKLMLFLISVVGLYPFVETFFMGGRTIIALLGATLVFVVFASFYKNTKVSLLNIKMSGLFLISIPKFLLKKTIVIPMLLVGLIFISYSIDVVDKRLTRFGYGNKTFKVWEQKDYQWVKFDEDFKNDYFNSTSMGKAKLIGLHNLKHYFTHGVIEYIRLVNDLDKTTGYYYGQYEFNIFFKFFKFLGLPFKSLSDLNSIVTRKSVYQTFWGPFYIDFGVFGIIVMFFWGRFMKRIHVYAKRGLTEFVVFYGYLATIILTSFYLNFLLGSSSYYLFAFFVTIFFFRFWPTSIVLKKQQ